MAINQSKYIAITSSLVVGVSIPPRNMGLRIFANNTLIPTWQLNDQTKNRETITLSFKTPDEVADFFGSSSFEYAQAAKYFNYSDRGNVPKELQFASWAKTAQTPRVFGAPGNYKIADFTGITSGGFTITMGANTYALTALDFSTDTTLAQVATRIQTAIIAAGSGALWDNATVVYDTTRKAFVLTGGATGDALIDIVPDNSPTATNLAKKLGWGQVPTRIVVCGVDATSITDTFNNSVNSNNNFHSNYWQGAAVETNGVWVETPASVLEATEICEVGAGSTPNWSHIPLILIKSLDDVQDYYDACSQYPACATLDLTNTEFAHFVPAQVIASIDWTVQNGIATPNWKAFGRVASVDTDETKDFLDELKVNYIGRTQTNGAQLPFYQTGVVWGGVNDADTFIVHAGEAKLKADISASLFELFLNTPILTATESNRLVCDSFVKTQINKALNNGSILIGGNLSETQQNNLNASFKSAQNPNPVLQITSGGYVLESSLPTVAGKVGYKYRLAYKRAEEIRFVDGSHLVN